MSRPPAKELTERELEIMHVAWEHGSGPEVLGTGEALLMAMTGRPAAVDELGGAGQPILAARLR